MLIIEVWHCLVFAHLVVGFNEMNVVVRIFRSYLELLVNGLFQCDL